MYIYTPYVKEIGMTPAKIGIESDSILLNKF